MSSFTPEAIGICSLLTTMTPAGDEAPLRVCFLTPDHPSQGVNGPTRDALQTARALVAAGDEAHLIGYGSDTSVAKGVDGVCRHQVKVTEHIFSELADVPVARELHMAVAKYREVLRLNAQAPIDLVISTPWPGESLVCLLDRRLTVVTRLVTPVKLMTDTGMLAGEPWLTMGRLERAVITRSRHFSAASAAIVTDTMSTFGVKLPPISPVPLGTVDRTRQVTRGERLAGPHDVAVLSVGRLEPRKGVDVLLEAARRLASALPRSVYVFVGDGEWEDLRREVEMDAGLRGRVLLLGRVDDDRLWRLYAGADLVCVPSRYESFGQVLIEAMMFGKPIVASAVGGIPSVVEEGGNALLAAPGDPDQLARCLRKLISSPELRNTFGGRSRKLYEERYSSGPMGARKAEHLRGIVEAEREMGSARGVPGWWARIRRRGLLRSGAAADPRSLRDALGKALEEVATMEPDVASRVAAELLAGSATE